MKKNIIYLITTTVILVIVVFTWLNVKQSSKSPMKNSIVVLPFSSDSDDSIDIVLTPEEEQLLGKSRKVESSPYDIFPKDFQSFADSLSSVNRVIESSIIDKNDSVEIQIRLLDEAGDQIWTKTYMSGKDELSEIYDKILEEITETINNKSDLGSNN